ncbi:MAG: serine/threonine protein kinase [Deltaproteobacteria bacterium]|jgi:serine/threonine protein kinase|nr:serine/threonine protein kinase [Deltaproteobacteria bacterium]
MPTNYHVDALGEGDTLGAYVIANYLNAGAFGITYRATHSIIGSTHVIKEYLPTNASRTGNREVVPRTDLDRPLFDLGLQKFLQEAQILHRLEHENVVKVTDVFRSNNTAYFVMPYLEGQTFREWMAANRPPSKADLFFIMENLLRGLAYLHEKEVLHRDIKPENIYILNNRKPILIDFGSAKNELGEKSKTLQQILTPRYAPYEQYDTSATHKASLDIYSLSACFYEAINASAPMESPARVSEDKQPKLAGNDLFVGMFGKPALEAIDKGLAVWPKDRFQNCDDYLAALKVSPEPTPFDWRLPKIAAAAAGSLLFYVMSAMAFGEMLVAGALALVSG